MEAMPPTDQSAQKQPQQKLPNNDSDLRAKIMAAKSTLGLKDLNVSAAMGGFKAVAQQTAKMPNANPAQVLNRLSPNLRKHYVSLGSSVPSHLINPAVPMNQFRSTLQKLKQAGRPLMNSTEVEGEIISESPSDQPPPMLLLKRVGIRIFPDGRRVAMYNNDRLGISFTIPFGSAGAKGIIPQSTSPLLPVPSNEETIMESLDQVAKFAQQENVTSHAKHFKFADGSKLKVSHGAAKAIHMVHGALNPENQKKFADMLNTPQGFEKAAHFALSKVNFTIGGK